MTSTPIFLAGLPRPRLNLFSSNLSMSTRSCPSWRFLAASSDCVSFLQAFRNLAMPCSENWLLFIKIDMDSYLTHGLLYLYLTHELLLEDPRSGVHLVLEPHGLPLPGRGSELVHSRLIFSLNFKVEIYLRIFSHLSPHLGPAPSFSVPVWSSCTLRGWITTWQVWQDSVTIALSSENDFNSYIRYLFYHCKFHERQELLFLMFNAS